MSPVPLSDPRDAVDPLRPATFDTFTGQDNIKKELSVVLDAATHRNETPPHMLFSGPPGLGKTTLAGIVAHTADMPLLMTSGPAITHPNDLSNLLVTLDTPTVVFVDEVHQLSRAVEETLYTAMEDNRIDIFVGEPGTPRRRAIPVDLVGFTLVGATTRIGSLGAPFRDRFGYIARLHPYNTDTLVTILLRNADLLSFTLTHDAAHTIAIRSRGTPRIANRLLRRVRDYAHSHNLTEAVTGSDATSALELFGIDSIGLDNSDRELLTALCRDFNGGPVGLSTLAAIVGESATTVEELHEPFLMQSGLLARTPRGRIATTQAFTHLNLTPPAHYGDDAMLPLP